LVISFGKTLFSDAEEQPEIKILGLSKLVGYSKAGVVSASEAMSVQQQMDVLGKFGWELISIVGSIGGDQQMIFRRSYDSRRSINEEALIRAEGERLLALQQKASVDVVPPEEQSAKLEDLDEIEKKEKIVAAHRVGEMRLASVIDLVKQSYPISEVVYSRLYPTLDSPLVATITVNGTSELLKEGNKYRGTEARDLALSVAGLTHTKAGLKPGYAGRDSYVNAPYGSEVILKVKVVIEFDGKPTVVAKVEGGGKWP
jgi:hypothetical protein